MFDKELFEDIWDFDVLWLLYLIGFVIVKLCCESSVVISINLNYL